MKDLTTQNKIWLALRFIALPAMLLLPFMLVAFTGATCFGANETNIAVGIKASTGPAIFTLLLWITVVVFLICSFVQIGFKKYRLRFEYAKQQLAVALASAIITVPIYILMYVNSQGAYPPNWYCDSNLQLHGGLAPQALFGLGLDPRLAAIFVVIYLAAPLLSLGAVGHKKRWFWTV